MSHPFFKLILKSFHLKRITIKVLSPKKNKFDRKHYKNLCNKESFLFRLILLLNIDDYFLRGVKDG